MNTGDRIRLARKNKGWSQERLAEECGWESQGRISQYERGIRSPSYSDLIRIAERLGVKSSYLLTGEYQTATGAPSSIQNHATAVPVLDWDDVRQWIDEGAGRSSLGITHTTALVGNRAFALEVANDVMESHAGWPSYPPEAVIIVDPDRKADNGDRVIALLPDSNTATFKEIVFDGPATYLKPLNPAYPTATAPTGTVIAGVVVQTIINE